MRLVAIKSFDNYFSANIASTLLEEHNIFCFLKDEYSATINPVYNNVIGGIKLMVDVNDVEAASEILLKLETEYLKTKYCKNCREQKIISVLAIVEKSRFQKFISKIFGDKNIITEKYYQCENCGNQSYTLEEI